MNTTLWFYWGQRHLSYLRWLTLYSARQVHEDVTLVLRREPVQPSVRWREQQDFQSDPIGPNYLNRLPDIKVVTLETIAPEIAELNAPDVHTADLLKWWLLAKFGGTVADMDIVFLRPIPVITHNVQVTVFSDHPRFDYLPVTFMQGNCCPAWWRSFEKARREYDPNCYESCGSHCVEGERIGTLSERVVYPWAGRPWSLWHNWLFEADQWPAIPENCIGIHWYAGHNQRYNRIIQGPDDWQKGAVMWAAREVQCASR